MTLHELVERMALLFARELAREVERFAEAAVRREMKRRGK
jgi:hypothetical protein